MQKWRNYSFMRFIRLLAAWLWEHLGTISMVIGWIASFGVPAWFASATEWLGKYGPIAWVSAGFIGVLVFSMVWLVVAVARKIWINSTVHKKFYDSADRVNPMETYFSRKRIKLEDLLPPGSGFVEGKTFEDCELIGPLNVLSIDSFLESNRFESVDHIAISPSANVLNARVFHKCHFRRCKFFNVSFLIAAEFVEHVTNWGGTNWITLPLNKGDPALTPSLPAPPDTESEKPL
ncbi:hypothetical protein [Aestuariivirga sp.]|uniref:hypothetical protein n=1 Tax=Aestuariivirga sp. TaxID=2650926 RepID=UPI0039E57487